MVIKKNYQDNIYKTNKLRNEISRTTDRRRQMERKKNAGREWKSKQSKKNVTFIAECGRYCKLI